MIHVFNKRYLALHFQYDKDKYMQFDIMVEWYLKE